MEVAFVGVGVQVVFLKVSENLTDMFVVVFHGAQVDEDDIQVDMDGYVKHVREYVIHEVLKSCWCISQTNGYNTPVG